jgi:hypothetical protein
MKALNCIEAEKAASQPPTQQNVAFYVKFQTQVENIW